MRTFLISLVLLALAMPSEASHCSSPSTATPEVDTDAVGLGAPRYYADLFVCGGSPDCMFSLWVYEESNGVPGLQRGDEEVDNTCHGMIDGDTIVF